ncbi:MAG: hypothetical protein WBN92_17485, partial [Terriglobia bacterium]
MRRQERAYGSSIVWLVGLWVMISACAPFALRAQAPNPTSLTVDPPSIVIPGNVTFCAAGGAGMTVDLKYLWNGVPYETDSGFIFDSNGCKQLLYDNNAYAADYQFTAIRNSLNAPNGVWANINPPLSLSLRIAAPNPTSLTAAPTSIVMPGNITFCAAGGANMVVDLQYTWNGVAHEA